MKTVPSNEDPYGEILCRYFQQNFPEVSEINNFDLLEILTNVIIGTKEVRYGPIPPPEALVVIRKAISTAIANNTPIPILISWGSIKSNFSFSLDVAEVSAIQTLVKLSKTVQRYYPKGLEVVIRIEDTSGKTLFDLEGDKETIAHAIDVYSNDFQELVRILTDSVSIRAIKESEMPNADQFNEKFVMNRIHLQNYLNSSRSMIKFNPDLIDEMYEYKELLEVGWRGKISQEQREHYISAYQRLYPDWSEVTMYKRLALYFAGALTRFHLNMTGKQDYWTDFIQLSFTPPIKGLPEGYNHNYIYYRTLPLSSARTHVPAWRAKGYFKIQGNNVVAKLTTFNDSDLISKLVLTTVQIQEGETILNITADYLLEDMT